MTSAAPTYATLDEWIAREAIPFDLDDPRSLDPAVDTVAAALGETVELLGIGEPLHGGEEILILRNRLFQRLVAAHGFRAIAIESSYPRARVVNESISGVGQATADEVAERGWSHGFGHLAANRELVAWMREYNADPAHGVPLRFYGFDIPAEAWMTYSPRQLLSFVLDELTAFDAASGAAYREQIEVYLGEDAVWENPAATMDPAQAIGRSEAATALRLAMEALFTELLTRRPEFIAKAGHERFAEALHDTTLARNFLTYHAGLAETSDDRVSRLLGLRDAMMADTLTYIAERERGRGKVLIFAHNSHLQRGLARWQGFDMVLEWWPAGAHLDLVLGPRYAIVGSAIGLSQANRIGPPEVGTLDARLLTGQGTGRFIPTHRGAGLPAAEIGALPTRAESSRNPGYFPLTAQHLRDFDWLVILDEVTYHRGGPPLPPEASPAP